MSSREERRSRGGRDDCRDYIPFYRPSIEDDDVAAVERAMRSGWLTTGPVTKEFEKAFAAVVGARHALAVNSCTSGLHLGLVAMGVGPGDEVITTPYTFVATAATIVEAGATPVLVDVEPDTLNIDPAAIEKVISARTKCIVPVHFAGHPCEMDAILALACDHGVKVMEDAAHAFPAAYKARAVGSMGWLTVFSFYATKNLTTGEGGMVTTPDDEMLEKMSRLALHGMDRDAWKRYDKEGSWYYEVSELGFKYNLSDMASALGLSQLRKMDRMVERRKEIAVRYAAALGDDPAFDLPVSRPEVDHAWHLYVVRLRDDALTIDRGRFVREMAARGVGCSVHFIPVHLHPYYRRLLGVEPGDFPNAFQAFERAVTLPLFPDMTDGEVDRVIAACHSVSESFRR